MSAPPPWVLRRTCAQGRTLRSDRGYGLTLKVLLMTYDSINAFLTGEKGRQMRTLSCPQHRWPSDTRTWHVRYCLGYLLRPTAIGIPDQKFLQRWLPREHYLMLQLAHKMNAPPLSINASMSVPTGGGLKTLAGGTVVTSAGVFSLCTSSGAPDGCAGGAVAISMGTIFSFLS